jgi:hypothetical protein
MTNINSPTPVIAAEHERWRSNRDAVKGKYAVKAAGERYLPKPRSDMTLAQYHSYSQHVSFYPAVSRTVDGIVGLMLRKVPALEATGILEEVKGTITRDGRSVDELARDVVRETLITNFTGLLVDLPVGRASTAAEALENNLRPFVGVYPAESILEVQAGVVRGQRVPVRVRLLENGGNQVRELRLNDRMQYEVVLHTRDTDFGEFAALAPIVPTLDGQPLNAIPFVLVSTEAGFDPKPAQLDHAVNLNFDHYRTQGLLATVHLHQSSPMLVATGVGNAEEQQRISIAPGQIMCLENPEAKVFYVEPAGDGIPSLERELERIEDKLAVVGARILARQKKVAEAAETEALRQGAENATLATVANAISRRMEAALNIVSAWMQAGPVQFQLNTDYLPMKMDASEVKVLLEMRMADELDEETFFLALRDRGVLNETLTIAEFRARKARSPAPAQPVASTNNDGLTV